MQFSIQTPWNVIGLFVGISTWIVILYFGYSLYQKQANKPKIWKLVVVTIVGLFTFSLHLPLSIATIKLPILPLGVWILYWYAASRTGAWEKYRAFAWLGFFANFLFIGATVMTLLLNNLIFPKSELTTFISNYDNAAVYKLHPSVEEGTLDIASFHKQISLFEEHPIQSDIWYNEITLDKEPSEREERFPYQLIGTEAKWGSGLQTMIYIENDGKGLLITTAEKQSYFRTTELFMKGGNGE